MIISFSDVGISDLEFGWCFLENIVDPQNPTNDCYEDVAWSEVDGRFWSNIACFEENQRPQGNNPKTEMILIDSRFFIPSLSFDPQQSMHISFYL